MDNLFTYIAAIKGHRTVVSIIHRTVNAHHYIDGDIAVDEELTSYTFDNGVVIQYHAEKDSVLDIAIGENGTVDNQVCEECWISYQVVESGIYAIRPTKKVFYNICQEAFWMKIQLEQQLAH
ncbi:hypothetical protein [Photobacterium kagoshimensis]|uniref:hypothetical protein n=1 Tax=Photobacterium kagoshimensis TaxID=2910242 RepID=UPI003D09A65A